MSLISKCNKFIDKNIKSLAENVAKVEKQKIENKWLIQGEFMKKI